MADLMPRGYQYALQSVDFAKPNLRAHIAKSLDAVFDQARSESDYDKDILTGFSGTKFANGFRDQDLENLAKLKSLPEARLYLWANSDSPGGQWQLSSKHITINEIRLEDIPKIQKILESVEAHPQVEPRGPEL